MKLATEPRVLETSGVVEELEYSIEVTPQAMEVLSGLYSDIPWAIVREYGTNMLDAYVKLPPDAPRIPPELHVPNTMEPWIGFKDYGIGMSEQTVRAIFTRYFASTKRDNNDEVGGLGLGSKTAFAYEAAETWAIESRFNGKLLVFHATKNERHIPALNLIGVTDTDEPNGVTIKIPVAIADIERFRVACARLVQYYPVPITVTGGKIEVQQLEYTLRGSNWGLRRKKANEPGCTAIMGNVPYPIVEKELTANTKFDHRFIYNWVLDIWVPVGELRFVPSREQLMYTPRVRERLKQAVEEFMTELPDLGSQQIQSAPSRWAALELLNKMFVTPLSDLITNAQWHGEPLNLLAGIEVPRSTFSDNIEVRYLKNDTRSLVFREVTPLPPDAVLAVHPARKWFLVLDDLDKGATQLVRRFLLHECSRKVSWKVKRDWQEDGHASIFKNITAARLSQAFGGAPVKLTSELLQWEQSLLAAQPNTVLTARKPTRVRVFLPKAATYQVPWEETVVDANAGGFWVGLNNTDPVREGLSNRILRNVRRDALLLNYIPTGTQIFGIPRSCSALERKPGWIDVCAFIEGKMKTDLDEAMWKSILTWRTWEAIAEKQVGKLLFAILATDHQPVGQAADLFKQMRLAMPDISKVRALSNLASAFQITPPEGVVAHHDGASAFETLLIQYPMLAVLNSLDARVALDLQPFVPQITSYLK